MICREYMNVKLYLWKNNKNYGNKNKSINNGVTRGFE
jgi:hypothetical protein